MRAAVKNEDTERSRAAPQGCRGWLFSLAAALLALAAGSACAQQMVLTPVKITPHVYYFHGHTGMADPANQGFMSNAALSSRRTVWWYSTRSVRRRSARQW